MKDFRIAAAQFEPKSLDRKANLKTIAELTARAAKAGAQAVCFQEQATIGYNLWGEKPDPRGTPVIEKGRVSPAWDELGVIPSLYAESVPGGPCTDAFERLARKHKVVIMAGVLEASSDNSAYNTYVVVGPKGYIGKYRKVHLVPGGEDQYFRKGNAFPVFDIGFCKMGALICYDNHFPEAHRVLAVQGAQLIVMPHVTAAKSWWPSQQDVRGAMAQAKNWVLTWCRARAFDNSAYVVFVNQGSENPERENGPLGCSMILDPDGHVMAESARPGKDVIFADASAAAMAKIRHRAHDYLKHRRPDLYGPLCDTTRHMDPY